MTVGAAGLQILAKKVFTPGKAYPRGTNWEGLQTQDQSGFFFGGFLGFFQFFFIIWDRKETACTSLVS